VIGTGTHLKTNTNTMDKTNSQSRHLKINLKKRLNISIDKFYKTISDNTLAILGLLKDKNNNSYHLFNAELYKQKTPKY